MTRAVRQHRRGRDRRRSCRSAASRRASSASRPTSSIKHFDELRSVKLRVGALPQHPNNVLKYSLTWSTEGLINEYGNPCEAIVDGQLVEAAPLEGLEEIEIDGTLYEAFNTSGGLGSLGETYGTARDSMNYKTMRYPGHCAQMRLLMNDLKLNHDRAHAEARARERRAADAAGRRDRLCRRRPASRTASCAKKTTSTRSIRR